MAKKTKVVAAEGKPAKKLEASGMMPAKKFNSLVAQGRAAYKDQRSISGEFGASVKEAKEHDHLHTKAFSSYRGLDRMEPEKLADFFAHFDYYCEIGGLRKRAGAVLRMPLDEEGADAETGDAGARSANVRPFPSPMGHAAE